MTMTNYHLIIYDVKFELNAFKNAKYDVYLTSLVYLRQF